MSDTETTAAPLNLAELAPITWHQYDTMRREGQCVDCSILQDHLVILRDGAAIGVLVDVHGEPIRRPTGEARPTRAPNDLDAQVISGALDPNDEIARKLQELMRDAEPAYARRGRASGCGFRDDDEN